MRAFGILLWAHIDCFAEIMRLNSLNGHLKSSRLQISDLYLDSLRNQMLIELAFVPIYFVYARDPFHCAEFVACVKCFVST